MLTKDQLMGPEPVLIVRRDAGPLRPLADRLEDAAAIYPFLRRLLLEAAQRIRTEDRGIASR